MKITTQDWVLLFTLSILWGGGFFFAAIAVKEVPPLTLVLCRVGIAAIVLLIFLRAKGEALPTGAALFGAFFVMGLLNNLIPFSLLFWAQTSITSGLASILNATTPIFSLVVAHFLLVDERMTSKKFIGVVLGFLGVAVLIGGNALNDLDIATFGIIACLGAALSFGFAGVYGRRFRTMGVSPSAGAFGQLAATTAMMVPIVALIDMPWNLPLPSLKAIISIITLAAASTALAYLIFFRLLATTGAVNASLVTVLIPISAIILGTTFLGEELALRHYIGMVLILAGLIVVDGRLIRKV